MKVVDNDKDEITVMDGDKEVRGWSYATELERRAKILCAREFVEGWHHGDGRPDLGEICKELGCTTAPGVALRFAKELRRDLGRAHQRHVELIQTWDDASPTERMARRTDLQAAMRSIEAAMTSVLPDEEKDEEPTWEQLQVAYDRLSKAHREIIDLLQALPELAEPDPVPATVAA
jgi:cellobiose-specific phosphotransferase system component IIA